MSVYISLHAGHHGTARITARAPSTTGAPLILEVTEADGARVGEITIFTGFAAIAAKLAEVINFAQATVACDLSEECSEWPDWIKDYLQQAKTETGSNLSGD
jgi:hypothetical protein